MWYRMLFSKSQVWIFEKIVWQGLYLFRNVSVLFDSFHKTTYSVTSCRKTDNKRKSFLFLFSDLAWNLSLCTILLKKSITLTPGTKSARLSYYSILFRQKKFVMMRIKRKGLLKFSTTGSKQRFEESEMGYMHHPEKNECECAKMTCPSPSVRMRIIFSSSFLFVDLCTFTRSVTITNRCDTVYSIHHSGNSEF